MYVARHPHSSLLGTDYHRMLSLVRPYRRHCYDVFLRYDINDLAEASSKVIVCQLSEAFEEVDNKSFARFPIYLRIGGVPPSKVRPPTVKETRLECLMSSFSIQYLESPLERPSRAVVVVLDDSIVDELG